MARFEPWPTISAALPSASTHCTAALPGLESLEGLSLSADRDKEVDRLAKLIHTGKLKKGQLDKKLLKQTAKKLLEGVGTGYLRDPGSDSFTAKDKKMLEMLSDNIYIFSGFKTYEQLKEASGFLLDDNGEIRPFADFKAKIAELDARYNLQYLATEYNQAIVSAQMASKWVTFQDLQEDFPNLIYRTAGDDRVRPAHAALDGIIKPIDDVFWNSNYPPNGWGCRCDVDATDDAVTTKAVKSVSHGKLFNNNVGKDGIIFPESHPYFDQSEATRKRITNVVRSIHPGL